MHFYCRRKQEALANISHQSLRFQNSFHWEMYFHPEQEKCKSECISSGDVTTQAEIVTPGKAASMH